MYIYIRYKYIQNQWFNIIKCEIRYTPSFWIQVHKFNKALYEREFKELSTLVLSLLVLQFCNASVNVYSVK